MLFLLPVDFGPKSPQFAPSLISMEKAPGRTGDELTWGIHTGTWTPLMLPVLVHTRAWREEQWEGGGPLSLSVHIQLLGIPSPAPHPAPALPTVPPCPAALPCTKHHVLGWPWTGTRRDDLRSSFGLAVISRALVKAPGKCPPAPAGSGSGPTQGQSDSCQSFTMSVKCSFCPASLSPSPHSSYSSTQKASSSEHFKIQGDSIQHRRLFFFFFLFFSSSLISSIFHTKCLQALSWGR